MATRKNESFGVVYSTTHGRMCPACGNPIAECACRQDRSSPRQDDGIVKVGRSTKGRKGKEVTVITGLSLNDEDLKKLAKQLKQKCGSGGTVKDGTIEVQGEHCDKLLKELQALGYAAKRSGG